MSLKDAIFKFRELKKAKAEADRKLMELMCHPDVEVEQLVEANKIAVRVEQGLQETVTALRKRWKATDTIVVTPWNAPEFDKYVNRS